MKITHTEIEYDIELDNVSYDHDYWCDAYISSATDISNNRELDGAELDILQEELSIDMDNIIMNWLY